MKEKSYRYVLAGREGLLWGKIPTDFRIISPADNYVLASNIADCLNAERIGAEAVIWTSEDLEQLRELSPRNSDYGWMLVSINIPIIFNITRIEQLELLENIRVDGFYSDDLNLLLETRKKMEPLPSE